MTTAAILLAGGSGTRMRRGDNKVFAEVAERSLLDRSLRAFVDHACVDTVVLVVRAADRERVDAVLDAAGWAGAVRTTMGGATRQASEQAGLEALADPIGSGAVTVVAIHDVARPFAGAELIAAVVGAARDVGGAVPVLALGAGIHRHTPDGRLVPQGTDLHRVQTPQAFRAAALLAAYRAAARDGFAGVDTVETVQRYTDLQIAAVPGDPANIKVTYAGDLAAAEQIVATRR